MLDLNHYKKLINARLVELGARMHEIDDELGEPKSADLNDQSIDIEYHTPCSWVILRIVFFTVALHSILTCTVYVLFRYPRKLNYPRRIAKLHESSSQQK